MIAKKRHRGFLRLVLSFRQRVSTSRFLKSILTLASGTVIGQGINVLGTPIVSRVYTPADMGDYTLITANAGIVMSVACLGLMTAFMVPEDDNESRGLCSIAMTSTLMLGTLIAVALYLFADTFVLFRTEGASYTMSLLALWSYVQGNTLNSICIAYANRHKAYRDMFWNPIVYATTNMVLSVILGYMGFGFIGYSLATVLAFMASSSILLVRMNPFSLINIKEQGFLRLLFEYRRFPLFQMPANVVSSLSQQLPALTLSEVYSSSVLGMYSMANRLLSIPSQLLSTPVNRIYYQEACDRYNKGGNVGEFAFKLLKTNVRIAVVPLCTLVVFGRGIFSLVLGSQWADAGSYASIMGLYQLMLFCAGCLSGSFTVIRRNSLNLVFSIIVLCVNFILYILFTTVFDASTYVYLTTLTVAMTVKVIVEQGVFFWLTGVSMKSYVMFVLYYIVLPFITSFVIGQFITYK